MKKLLLLIALFSTVFSARAQVQASFNVSDSNICAGQDVIFTFTGQGANLYQWDFGDGSVLHSTTNPITTRNFRETGTYKVYLFATNGSLTDTAEIFIRVRPKIESSFSFNETSNGGFYCLGTRLSISQWSNIAGFDSLNWDFGDGTTASVLYPSHTYKSVGDFTVTLKVKGFCGEGQFTQDVKIVDDLRGKPQGGLSINPINACPEEILDISAWQGNTPVDSVKIDLGDGNVTSLDEFDYQYSTEGKYDVTAVSYNRCGADTSTKTVNITNTPTRNGNVYVNNRNACIGQEVRGSAFAQSSDLFYVDYGDGSKDTLDPQNSAFRHKYMSNGTYTIEATFVFPCGPDYKTSTDVTIGTGPDVFNFSINTYRNIYCLGEEVQFNPPWLYPGDTLDIDFGDGNTKRFVDTIGQVFHLYNKADNYTVKATKSNVCGFSRQAQGYVRIVDDAKPRLTVSSDYKREGNKSCEGDTIMLMMQAEGFVLKNTSFTFEDGSMLAGQQVRRPFNKGEHLIKATAQNLCGQDLTGYFSLDVINHTVNPSLSYYYYPTSQCVNQAFFFDVFANGAKKITWNMGDGNTLVSDPNFPHFMYAYKDPGTYTVNLVATNGCGSNAASSDVHVVSGPELTMTHTSLDVNIGDTIRFVNTSANSRQQFWVFDMDLEDTSNAKEITRSYPQKGVYTVSLFGMNQFGCWDTINKTIRVGMVSVNDLKTQSPLYLIYPNPGKDLMYIKPLSGNTPIDIKFYDVTGKPLSVKTVSEGGRLYQTDVSSLPNGVYIVYIEQEDNVRTARVVIQR